MSINRIAHVFAAVAALCAFVPAEAGEFASALVGRVTYTDTPGWSVAVETKTPTAGVEEWRFSFAADKPSAPPKTTIECALPLNDAVGRWTTGAGLFKKLPPNWAGGFSSTLYSQAPVIAYFSDSNENRGVVACSEALRRVNFEMGIVEETAQSSCKVSLFSESEPPLSSYEVSIRVDLRPVFYADALRETFAWYETMPTCKPVAVPVAAFDPLYSFWYSYHQEVTAPAVEKECAAAVPYGMKTIIVDDGWQTDDNNRGYSSCGDWQVSTNRFPDFAAHVKKVHALGLKYMIWYSVPMIGFKSKNHERFKGKYLWSESGRWTDFSCLDPRFPEVREFLIGNYEHALRVWGVDGLKLDFIDSFSFRGEDPAVKENYAGRDIKSLSEAIDRLMTDINKRLAAIKPDVLIEFRQSYVGPAIRKYGNMFRAGDCPMDTLVNRVSTLDLRLSSGNAAVHSDMLMWNAKSSPETMSKQFWSILFAVPQISMRLGELPAAHRAKLREMLDFWLAHRDTLMKGELRPMRPDLNYPIVYAYGKDEQIVAVYDRGQVVDVDRTRGAKVYVVNATDAEALVVRENGRVREVKIAPCSHAQLD